MEMMMMNIVHFILKCEIWIFCNGTYKQNLLCLVYNSPNVDNQNVIEYIFSYISKILFFFKFINNLIIQF